MNGLGWTEKEVRTWIVVVLGWFQPVSRAHTHLYGRQRNNYPMAMSLHFTRKLWKLNTSHNDISGHVEVYPVLICFSQVTLYVLSLNT